MAQNLDPIVLSHWNALFRDFSASTQEFYQAVAVRQRNPPEAEVSRVLFKESGIGEYLRVRRKRVAFAICSVLYCSGHTFPWWLAKVPTHDLRETPVLIYTRPTDRSKLTSLCPATVLVPSTAGWREAKRKALCVKNGRLAGFSGARVLQIAVDPAKKAAI